MKYDKIVLNIPHAGMAGLGDAHWSSSDKLNKYMTRWTDWLTDVLFGDTAIAGVEAVVFPYSRFVCDAERLIDDPLEEIGQGVLYTKFEDIRRTLTEEERTFLMGQYYAHQEEILNALTPGSILIDCHSFPSDLSEIDVCIGFNDDWSRPEAQTIRLITEAFERKGYKVGINTPYSNSISPKGEFPYPSVMIELNKRVYFNEADGKLKYPEFCDIKAVIEDVYSRLLGGFGG